MRTDSICCAGPTLSSPIKHLSSKSYYRA